MTMRSEERALMRAVCENPADQIVRLVYADWLDEIGQSQRAAFIRFEIESERHLLEGGRLPADYTERRRRSLMERARWVRELPEIRGVEWQDLYRGGFPSGAIVASVPIFISRAQEILDTIPLWSVQFRSAEPQALVEAARMGLLATLGEIDLTARGVGASGIAALFQEGACPRLENLFVASNGVTDQTVKFLARHGCVHKLRWLDLSANPVGYEAVSEVLASPRLPDLRAVGLEWTRISESEVAEIRQQLARRPRYPGVPLGT